ncbi:MAG: SemiSWEET family transporter [Thermoplasmatota archaeon]
MFEITDVIGYIAATIGTSLMLPQIYKTMKTKRVDDISYGMLILYFTNCSIWLLYGLLLISWPLILCNFIALIISIIQIGLKQRYTSNI